jgi:hypothetical protein
LLIIIHEIVSLSIMRLFSPITFICRGGRGGGYKELDEEELEEVKRRRKEAEEVGHVI